MDFPDTLLSTAVQVHKITRLQTTSTSVPLAVCIDHMILTRSCCSSPSRASSIFIMNPDIEEHITECKVPNQKWYCFFYKGCSLAALHHNIRTSNQSAIVMSERVAAPSQPND